MPDTGMRGHDFFEHSCMVDRDSYTGIMFCISPGDSYGLWFQSMESKYKINYCPICGKHEDEIGKERHGGVYRA